MSALKMVVCLLSAMQAYAPSILKVIPQCPPQAWWQECHRAAKRCDPAAHNRSPIGSRLNSCNMLSFVLCMDDAVRMAGAQGKTTQSLWPVGAFEENLPIWHTCAWCS